MINVRRLTVGEVAGRILDLSARVSVPSYAPANPAYLAASWEALERNGTARTYGMFCAPHVARVRGLLLGLVVADLITGEKQGLEYLWITEPGFGFGAPVLLKHFERDCKSAGCSRVICGASEFAPEISKLKTLYTRMGYKPHAIAMSKRLS